MRSKVLLILLGKELKIVLRSPGSLILQIVLPVMISLTCIPPRINRPIVDHPRDIYYQEFRFDERPANLSFQFFKLHATYTPQDPLVESIIEKVARRTNISFKGCDSEEEAIETGPESFINPLFFAVIFNITRDGQHETYSYRLRFPTIARFRLGNSRSANYIYKSFSGLTRAIPKRQMIINNWYTTEIYPKVLFDVIRSFTDSYGGEPEYMKEGFLWVQNAIDESILSLKAESKDMTVPVVAKYMKRMPTPAFVDDRLPKDLSFQFVFVAIVSFSFAVLALSKQLVYEKEKGIEAILRIMGISRGAIWTSYLIRIVMTYIITCMLLTIVLTAPIKTPNYTAAPIFRGSNPFLVFVMWFQYLLTTVAFVFMTTRIFQKASNAATFTAIFYVVTIAPWFVISVSYYSVRLPYRYISCLISNIAFTYCLNFLWHWESQGLGLTFATLGKRISQDDPFTFINSYIMLIVDLFIYLAIGLYLEQVYPGEYGVPKPWYFIFQRSFWHLKRNKKKNEPNDEKCNHYFSKDKPNIAYYEEKSDMPMIQVRGLSKIYRRSFPKSKIAALSNVDVNFYNGEVAALLGQNGAGKSTLVNILIGTTEPTSGVIKTAYRCPLSETAKYVGFCPQYNVVIDKLTVVEHLQFFAKLRYQRSLCLEDFEHLIQSLGLGTWRNVAAENLSGGKKRALSLAIAMIGNPKVIILDEPTSGMDPVSRQMVWDLLRNVKRDQCVIISTHYMEEANAIADRIVIISNGRVACSGSRQYLQNNFFDGYRVAIVRKPAYSAQSMVQSIHSISTNIQCVGSFGKELRLFIPNSEESVMRDLIEWLESYEGVDGFGISLLTLDEIFNRVTSTFERDEESDDKPDAAFPDNDLTKINSSVEQAVRAVAQLDAGDDEPLDSDVSPLRILRNKATIAFACLHKNMLYALRSQPFFTILQLFPALVTSLVLLFIVAVDIFDTPVDLHLDQSMFSSSYIPVQMLLNSSNLPPPVDGMPTSQSSLIYNSICDRLRAGGQQLLYVDRLNKSGQLTGCHIETMDDVLACIGRMDKQIYFHSFPLGFLVEEYVARGSYDSAVKVQLRFNGQPYHPQPVAANILTNSLMQIIDNGSSVHTSHYPLPTPKLLKEYEESQDTLMFTQTWGLFYGFGFSITLAGLAVSKINERSSGFKHLQYMAGVNSYIYWTVAFIGDYFHYLLSAAMCLVITTGFSAYSMNLYAMRPLLRTHLIWYLILVQAGYGACQILFVYLLSYLFDKELKAYMWVAQISIIIGQIPTIVMNVLSGNNINRKILDRMQKGFIALFPGFGMCSAATYISTNHLYSGICNEPLVYILCMLNFVHPCCKNTCGSNCATYTKSIVSIKPPGIGGILISFGVHFVIYVLLLIAIDYRLHSKTLRYMKRMTAKLTNRASTVNESMSLENKASKHDEDLYQGRPLVVDVRRVFKYYGKKIALRGINLQMHSGECMGIIGPNGAGKTTLLSIVTGMRDPSSGVIFIDERPVSRKNRQSVGYCPQNDALVNYMTGNETLDFFARICGYQKHERLAFIPDIVKVVGLTNHAHKPVGAFSGGNKRKLSIALAAIMGKRIVILDEPTCGVDPTSRQLLWNFLEALKRSNRSLLLTSHSMDECEALCSRISILIDGYIDTSGTVQELKLFHGRFYSLFVKTKEDPKTGFNTEGGLETTPGSSQPPHNPEEFPVGDFILNNFPNSKLLIRKPFYATFQLDKQTTSLHKLFKTLTEEKDRLRVENFSVCQENLEQLFLSMVKR